MLFNCGGGDAQLFGYLPIFEPFEAAEDKHFPASLRQTVDHAVNLLLQLVEENFLVGVQQKIRVIEPFLTLNIYQVIDPMLFYNGIVFQVIEAAVAHDGKQ